jgi:hypothetical protein
MQQGNQFTHRIRCQILMTSLLGFLINIFSLILMALNLALVYTFLSGLVMSFSCVLTSYFGRRALKTQTHYNAKRYSSCCLINMIIWLGFGIIAFFWEFLWLIDEAEPAVFATIISLWTAIYALGEILLFKYLQEAKEFRKSLDSGTDYESAMRRFMFRQAANPLLNLVPNNLGYAAI